jgi:integrase
LGAASAKRIEAFFATQPALTERARTWIAVTGQGAVVPWEALRLPHEVDGSSGTFRAPRHACTLDASNDYEAAQAEWRPFSGGLSARSAAHALSVLGAMFRWLIEQRYLLANPFASVKVRGSGRSAALDASHAFTEGEWQVVRTIADGLERSNGWNVPAAQRLRFLLDFAYATGLRASELAGTLGLIETDARGDRWVHLVGKGHKAGRVALPPLAWHALTRHLVERGLPVTPVRWPSQHTIGGQPRGRQRDGDQCGPVIGGPAALLRAGGRRDRDRPSRARREAEVRQPPLDAPHACHPCAGARRGTDDRAR